MIPTYLVDEIALRVSSPRLHPRTLKAVCRLLAIDLDAALDPTPTAEESAAQLTWSEELPYHGVVPFEFETRCGNQVRHLSGRIVYVGEGEDDADGIGRRVSTCEALVWDPWEPAPEWQTMPENALPADLVEQLTDAMDEAIENQRQSSAGNDSEA
jgi:hypothetical protein